MRPKHWFITSALVLLVGLIAVGSKWNGNAGLAAGWPLSQWKINFCGSVNGFPAMLGLICIVGALVLFLVAVVSGSKHPREIEQP